MPDSEKSWDKQSLDYFNKLPANRQKELRKTLRIWFAMRENGATYSEQQRLLRYAKIVVRPAYRYYSTSSFELGIQALHEKYVGKSRMTIGDGYMSYWIHKLLEEGY